MKLIICSIILFFGACHGRVKFSMEETCRKSSQLCWWGTNIACEDVRLCPGGIMIDLSPQEKQSIVDEHNRLRDQLASGRVSGYSQAARLGAVEWDDELTAMVDKNIRRCIYGHDKCRATENYPNAGQNLAYIKGYGHGTFNRAAVVAEFKTMINDWFNEYKDADMNVINKYRGDGRFNLHFTAIANEKNNRIGCSAVWYPEDGTGRVNFGCNYVTVTMQDQPVYVAGSAGSKCKNGRDRKFTSLCNTNEQYE